MVMVKPNKANLYTAPNRKESQPQSNKYTQVVAWNVRNRLRIAAKPAEFQIRGLADCEWSAPEPRLCPWHNICRLQHSWAQSACVVADQLAIIARYVSKVKSFLGPRPVRASLISVSLALSQTPAYTARPRIRGYCMCPFTPQLSLVLLTAPTHGGMARLSWPGWLVTYGDGLTLPVRPSKY